jgi:hypothetical protein
MFSQNVSLTRTTSVTCAAADIFIAIALGSSVWGLLATDVIPSQRNRYEIPPNHIPHPLNQVSLSRRFFLLSISAGVIVESNTLLMMMLLLKHSPGGWLFRWKSQE